MAEFVEFRAEEWIEELNQMERIHLFEPKEIKSIATKRREFEYKIQRKIKHPEDYLKYIQFEIDLYRIVKARRKKTGIKFKRAAIEFSQTHRIANLFKSAIFKFQNDIKLWMSFFKFCEEVKFHSLVSRMLVRMLQIHSDKPELWVFASTWELKQCNSDINARQFLTRGLRFHSKSELLYTELFKLELQVLQKKKAEKEKKMAEDDEWVPDDVMKNILDGKVVTVVYESAVKIIDGADFKVKLFNIAKNYEGTINIQRHIFNDLKKCHPMEEITWDTIAKQELEEISFDVNEENEGEPMEVDSANQTDKKPLRERLQRCVAVYQEAVEKLNTTKMWSLYLDHFIELNEKVGSLPNFKSKLLQSAFKEALDSGKMEEKYFLHWIQLIKKTKNKNGNLELILQKGTEQHPNSVKLWHSRLRFYLSKNQETTGFKIFNEAIKKVPDAISIWKLMLQYMKLKSHPKTEEFFQDGIKEVGELSQALKPLYLDWLASTKGIQSAREIFNSFEMQHPPCLELYNKMAELESNVTNFEIKNVRKCHELACNNFGQNNLSVWLEYIRFELNKGDLIKVNQIYGRAIKTLEPELVDEFIAEYNVFKTKSATE